VGGDIPIDSETFLLTDFMNLNIKSAQYFGCAHKIGCVYIYLYDTCINICACTELKKRI
jgi:hypothetical protein